MICIFIIFFMLQPAQASSEPAPAQKAEVAAEDVMTVAKDSRYARYLKMVQVVSMRGLDLSKKKVFVSLCYVLFISGGTSDGHSEQNDDGGFGSQPARVRVSLLHYFIL